MPAEYPAARSGRVVAAFPRDFSKRQSGRLNRAGRSFLFAAPLELIEPLILPHRINRADLPHPRISSIRQFRMLFVRPGSGRRPQSFALAAELDLALSEFRQKRTPPPLADQLIDVGNHIHGKNNMRSSSHTSRHTPSVT